MISAIVAIGDNRVIGKGNTLLWHIPADLKRFRALTTGHPIIMGRKTFDSILQFAGKPLPNRTHIVITRDETWGHEGAVTTHSLEEALKKANALDEKEVFIIGGAQIYEQALPLVERLYLTLIDDKKEGDAYFPEYESQFKNMLSHEHGEHEGLQYRWVVLERTT